MPGLNGISERFRPPIRLQEIARAEILDRTTSPTAGPPGRRRQANQVGVIIFAVFERGSAARSTSISCPRKGLGGGSVGNALEAGDGGLAAVAAPSKRCSAPPTIDFCMPGEAVGAAEQLQPNLTLDAMRAGDCGERDALFRRRRR